MGTTGGFCHLNPIPETAGVAWYWPPLPCHILRGPRACHSHARLRCLPRQNLLFILAASGPGNSRRSDTLWLNFSLETVSLAPST